jgi:hypothetical protein
MAAILKTWPAFMPPKKVLEVFTHDWGAFFFTLGRGRPNRLFCPCADPACSLHHEERDGSPQIYHTHRGRILGHFYIQSIVRNMGDNLPKLTAIDGTESEWQIKLMNWVAVCPTQFHPLEETLYHEGFRGWRYFDLEKYRGTIGAKVRI